MKLIACSLGIFLLPWLAGGLTGEATHAFSVELTLAEAASQKHGSPVVDVTVKNISSESLTIPASGAFFDYSVKLLDASGRPVPFTKEGRKIRFGEGDGFVIGSVKGIRLEPGESTRQDLVLQRYFDMKSPGIYTLQVTRKFDHPPDNVSSNVLSIDFK